MKSINPQDCEAQPELKPPAGYICVLRDVDSDSWRIEGARHPKSLVDSVVAERELRFGIELVSILETEDLAASAATLYERHHAELGENWLDLDEYQLDALRGSILQIDAHPSHYLARAEAQKTPAAPIKGNAGRRAARQQRDRWGLRRDYSPGHRLYGLYGAKSLKNYREPAARIGRQNADDPIRMALNMSERFAKFRESDAGKALQVVLFLFFVAIMCVTDGCS